MKNVVGSQLWARLAQGQPILRVLIVTFPNSIVIFFNRYALVCPSQFRQTRLYIYQTDPSNNAHSDNPELEQSHLYFSFIQVYLHQARNKRVLLFTLSKAPFSSSKLVPLFCYGDVHFGEGKHFFNRINRCLISPV